MEFLRRSNDRPETWVTDRTGHMGYTFPFFSKGEGWGCRGGTGRLWTSGYVLLVGCWGGSQWLCCAESSTFPGRRVTRSLTVTRTVVWRESPTAPGGLTATAISCRCRSRRPS